MQDQERTGRAKEAFNISKRVVRKLSQAFQAEVADFAALAFTSTTEIQCREFLIRSCAWDLEKYCAIFN